jgi:hypothetical protein
MLHILKKKKTDTYSRFNFPLLPGTLPHSLKEVKFGRGLTQRIEKDALPSSLVKLHFGEDFNQPIEKDVLPQSLKQLYFDEHYNQSIDKNVLPLALDELRIGNDPIELDTLLVINHLN